MRLILSFLEVNMTARYQRVVLKLSGEGLSGEQGYGIEPAVIQSIAQQVKDVAELGVETVIVVGVGNIWRGKVGSERGVGCSNGADMGMLAKCVDCVG